MTPLTFSRRARWFWPLMATILVTDCATKRAAEARLAPAYVPHPVVGDVVRLTLSYNSDAAMGLSLGRHSRPALMFLTAVALLVLAVLYRRTDPANRLAAIGLALVVGGALGNLVDRVRSPVGVVDFIDIGIGQFRFWTFNVADVGITLGALVLVLALARRP
ncbi:MAG TPA: signal peptidase II [Gemmatimonadales bacterium]|nr:signal peptidase II [Gemmatimonadales bacterium]